MTTTQFPDADNPAVVIEGDCRPVLAGLADAAVDAVITDPPYSAVTHDGARTGNTGDKVLIDFPPLADAEFVELCRQSVRVARRWVLMTCDWRHAALAEQAMPEAFVRCGVWCLSGGSRVYARTKNGDSPMAIKDMVRNWRPEDVQLWNGTRWTQVTGWAESRPQAGRLEVELQSGERLSCTANHVWPTQRGNVAAQELRVGDVIASAKLPEPDEPRTPAALDDADTGWLVGLYLAEGSRTPGGVRFAGHKREAERWERVRRIAAAFDATARLYAEGGNAVSIVVNSGVVRGIVEQYVSGDSSRNKALLQACWQRTDAFLAAVLDGYLHGDGIKAKEPGRWQLGFCRNRWLARSLRTLCARLGVHLVLRPGMGRYLGEPYPLYRGEIRLKRNGHHNEIPATKVVAVRGGKGRVFWDIGVADEPHLFALASGVLTHNCKPDAAPQFTGDRPGTGWEAVLILHRPGKKRWNGGGHHATWTCGLERNNVHPTQKPLALVRTWVRLFTDPGEVVLDPFGGSGTTPVAAVMEGRRAVMVEGNPAHAETARRRIAHALGLGSLFAPTVAAKNRPTLLTALEDV